MHVCTFIIDFFPLHDIFLPYDLSHGLFKEFIFTFLNMYCTWFYFVTSLFSFNFSDLFLFTLHVWFTSQHYTLFSHDFPHDSDCVFSYVLPQVIHLFLHFTLFLNLLGVWFKFSYVILLYFWCYFNSHMEFTHRSSLVKMHLHMLFTFTCKKTYNGVWNVRDFSVRVISFQHTYSLNYLYQSNKGRWEPRPILTKQSGFWL